MGNQRENQPKTTSGTPGTKKVFRAKRSLRGQTTTPKTKSQLGSLTSLASGTTPSDREPPSNVKNPCFFHVKEGR